MKLTKLITGSAACAAIVFALGNSTIQAQNLLADPSFESGTAASGGLGGWSPFNGAAFSTAQALTGTHSMLDSGGGGFSVPGSFQTLASAPGLQYDLTGFGLITSAPGVGTTFGELQITFFSGPDGSGTNLGTVATSPGNAQGSNEIISSSPIGSWISLDTGIAQAPAGAQSLEAFTIVIDQNPAAVYFDDISLVQVVPEPSTLALAGMALCIPIFFITRRRTA